MFDLEGEFYYPWGKRYKFSPTSGIISNGTVIAVGTSGGFGKRIMIYHGTDENGTTYVTVYAHLSQIKVSIGDKYIKAK